MSKTPICMTTPEFFNHLVGTDRGRPLAAGTFLSKLNRRFRQRVGSAKDKTPAIKKREVEQNSVTVPVYSLGGTTVTDAFEVELFNKHYSSFDPILDSCDAYVYVGKQRTRYAATLFTAEGIKRVMDEKAARSVSGADWFWCCDLLILRRIDEHHLKKAVAELMEEDCFESAFEKCDNANIEES